MRTLQNFTAHTLSFFAADQVTFDTAIRKHVAKAGAEPVKTLPQSGMLSAKIVRSDTPDYIDGVPVYVKHVTGIDPLPDGDGVCVVSALYAAAAAKHRVGLGRLYTVCDPVYSADGRTILGSLGICPAFAL